MELSTTAVRVEVAGGLARLTFCAPETGNAVDVAMIDALFAALTAVTADPAVRAVLLRGEGTFCTGMARDLAYVEGRPNREAIARFEACLGLLAESPIPTVACVEGVAAGGGVGLAAACDMVLAGPEARFSLPEARFGLIPATIAPYLLRRLPSARVRALALSTRAIGADEAFVIGLVDEILPDPLEAALNQRLGQLLKADPAALGAIKALLARPDAPGEGGARLAEWLERPEVRARLLDGGAS